MDMYVETLVYAWSPDALDLDYHTVTTLEYGYPSIGPSSVSVSGNGQMEVVQLSCRFDG